MSSSFIPGFTGPKQTQPPTTDTVIHVHDGESLRAALDAATGQETILLADGDYGNIKITQEFDAPVTLLAETLHGARFTGFEINHAKNIVLDGLHLENVPVAGSTKVNAAPFVIESSTEIVVRNTLFEGGDMDAQGSGNGFPVGRGLRVVRSDDVLLEDNVMETFWKALAISRSTDVVVRGNEIHDIRSDGINITRSDGVLIEANHIHDFRGNPATGDHADMIQMYSMDDGILPRNITITGNLLDIGAGTSAHGMLLHHTSQAKNKYGADVAFENVTITDNVLINGASNGLKLNTTHGAVVSGNVLVGLPGEEDHQDPVLKIQHGSTDVIMENNLAGNFDSWDDIPEAWQTSGNIAIQYSDPDAPNYYGDVFVNALHSAAGTPENVILRPDGPAAGAGAAMLAFDATPEAPTALGWSAATDVPNSFLFDASLSANADGLAGEGALFLWDFGDGHRGMGREVGHVYGAAGTYTAVLTVLFEDGSFDSFEMVIAVPEADQLTWDAETGQLIWHDFGEEKTISSGDASLGQTLIFTDTTMIKGPSALEEAFEGAQSVTVSAEITATSAGTILGKDNPFVVQINVDGELVMKLDGISYVSQGASLLDGDAHQISARFDGVAGTVTLVVDGVTTVHETDMTALPESFRSDFKLGSQKGSGTAFTGTLSALDLDINDTLYAVAPDLDPGSTLAFLQDLDLDPDLIEVLIPGLVLPPEFAPEPALAPVPVAAPAPTPDVLGWLEVGSLDVTQPDGETWHHVSFTQEIPDARVVMGPLSFNGGAPAYARVRNVTDTGFEFQIEEWAKGDPAHTTETISWIAASAGTHSLANGAEISVGRTILEDYDPVTVELEGFETTPFVIGQVTSDAGQDEVLARVQMVTPEAFTIALQEEEERSSGHAPETTDWIAFGEGWDVDEFVPTSAWSRASANPETDIAILAAMQSYTETDPAILRVRENGDWLNLRIQEDTTADAEVVHSAELVKLLVLEEGFDALYA